MKPRHALGAIAATFVATLACGGSNSANTFVAQLAGANETPPVTTTATGTATFTRNAGTVSYNVSATGLSASAQGGHAFVLESGTLTYRVVHKLHQVVGTSRQLEGRAVIQDDGTGRVQVRARVASFDSGNANRDAHMREATHEPVHPFASVK